MTANLATSCHTRGLRTLVGSLLALMTLFVLLPTRVQATTPVEHVDDLLGSIGGTVYINENIDWNHIGQYYGNDGQWHNIPDLRPADHTKEGDAVDLQNGWKIKWCPPYNTDYTSGYKTGVYMVFRAPDNGKLDSTGSDWGGFKLRFNRIGYTTSGEDIDSIIEFTAVHARQSDNTALNEPKLICPFHIGDKYGAAVAAVSTKDKECISIKSTFTTTLVKTGTETQIDPSNEFDTVYADIDQSFHYQDGGTKRDPTYNSPWREAVGLADGYKSALLGPVGVTTVKVDEENGVTWFRSSQNDDANAANNISTVVAKAGPKFVTGWVGDGCETSIGYASFVRVYPEWPDPKKSPETQVRKRGEIASFDITQAFPYVSEKNKATSIVVTDTLDSALDASHATVQVFKGGVDVTDNWMINISGQVVTATAKNTGHGFAEGEHTFRITAPVSQTAALDTYETEKNQDGTFRKVPNQASVAINGTAKTTNTTHVLVPYEASGSVQISAKKSLKGKQLEDQQFTFRLTDGQGAVVGEKKNDGTGDVTFDTIDFDQDDIGKTYTYTITELDDAKQGYTYDAHTETVKVKVEDAGGGKLNVVTEYDADGAQFENNYAPNVGFAVLKHDENDQPLGGAKFTLYLDDGDNKFTSMDSPATIYEDQALQRRIEGAVMTTDGQGKALCYGLDWGKTYWLKETTAPAGYTLDPDAHRVVVGEDGSISLVDEQGVSAKLPVKDGVSTMTIKNTRVASLPSTAGTGITPILFVGFALVLVGGGSILHVVRRRRYL